MKSYHAVFAIAGILLFATLLSGCAPSVEGTSTRNDFLEPISVDEARATALAAVARLVEEGDIGNAGAVVDGDETLEMGSYVPSVVVNGDHLSIEGDGKASFPVFSDGVAAYWVTVDLYKDMRGSDARCTVAALSEGLAKSIGFESRCLEVFWDGDWYILVTNDDGLFVYPSPYYQKASAEDAVREACLRLSLDELFSSQLGDEISRVDEVRGP